MKLQPTFKPAAGTTAHIYLQHSPGLLFCRVFKQKERPVRREFYKNKTWKKKLDFHEE